MDFHWDTTRQDLKFQRIAGEKCKPLSTTQVYVCEKRSLDFVGGCVGDAWQYLQQPKNGLVLTFYSRPLSSSQL